MSEALDAENKLDGPNLIGHTEAKATLVQSWQSGRMHHAWMLTGPMGIGKATLAERFSHYVLCRGNGDNDLNLDVSALAVRHQLHLLKAGAHPDFVLVRAAEGKDTIPIDDVRKIEPIFRRTASEGGWRVALIDGADQMTVAAQNAVLKILEEPPANALILLTASVPGRLLPTIRSRVRHMVLEPLTPGELETLTLRHYPQLENADRQELMSLAKGSFGALARLHQTGALEIHRETQVLLSAPQKSTQSLIAFATRLAGKGEDESFTTFKELFISLLEKSCRKAAQNNDQNELQESSADEALATALANRLGLAGCLSLFDKEQALFKATDGLHLDKKQVILTSVSDVQTALYE